MKEDGKKKLNHQPGNINKYSSTLMFKNEENNSLQVHAYTFVEGKGLDITLELAQVYSRAEK